MLRLTLEGIEVVDAIASAGSFSAAADRLHKVPSTVSYTVAKIEEQLDVKLFERHGPRVILTAVGKEMLSEGRRLLRAASDLECRLQRASTGVEAELRVAHDGMVPSASLLSDLKAFAALGYGTRLRLTTETLSGTWEALLEGRADLIIAAGEGPSGGGYRAVRVGHLEFAFCVAPTHLLAKLDRTLTVDDLADHTAIVIADSARAQTSRTVGVLYGQQCITVSDLATKIALQVAGLGYGFLPRELVRGELQNGRLRELGISEPKADETFWLATRTAEHGKALRWWWKRLHRELIPDILHGELPVKAAPRRIAGTPDHR